MFCRSLYDGNGSDWLAAGTGEDYVFSNGDSGTSVADILLGDDGNDTISIISGGGTNDLVFGQAGNDSLSCGLGVDTADGGSGTDTLAAGAACETVRNVP